MPSSDANRVGSGAGSPKRKSSKRPRFHSEMNDGPEKEEVAMDDVEMQPPTSRGKAVNRASMRRSKWRKRVEISMEK